MYKVYLADDETWIVIGLKKLIEKTELPFKVVGEAYNGVAALEEIEEKKPDVLITDIRMPGLNGIALMEKVREKYKDMKIIFVSGYAEFEYAQSALRMGAFDYILKPVGQEKIQEVLERLCAEFRKERGEETEEVQEETEPPVNPTVMKQIIKEIQERYTENITLSGLAETYGISIGYLSVQIKAELGLSFSEYITSKRIQKAKELLTDERLSIEAIAEMTGYNDYFYFIKVFKKNTGISPSKYRKNM